jgi:hypothetical protein
MLLFQQFFRTDVSITIQANDVYTFGKMLHIESGGMKSFRLNFINEYGKIIAQGIDD